MTTFDLPQQELIPLGLELEERQTLGLRERAPVDAPGRIALGRPQCIALDEKTVDRDAQRFLKTRDAHAYYLVALTCSFQQDLQRPLETAWLKFDLRLTGGAPGLEVVAWSLEPAILYKTIKVTRTVKLDASLKLTGIGPVPAEVGPSASRETHEEYERQAVFLEALGEGTSSAAWSFTRTPVAEIGGPFHLRLVAELPKAAQAIGTLNVGASIRQRAIGIFSYTANLQELPAARLLNIPDSA